MSVAVAEQETVICISRDSEECTVYTSDSTMMTKLDKLADPNNDNAPLWKLKEVHRMSGTKEIVGKTYITNKRLISRGIFPKSRFCRHILMYCRLAFRMQNVIMVH